MCYNVKTSASLVLAFGALLVFGNGYGQSFKDKMKAKLEKDNSAWYECGYVHKASLAEKANPMTLMAKGMSGALTDESNSDLGKTAISIFYQAHLHPQSIMRYPTKTPGWETCGDAVYAGFTNRNGVGLSSTDGQFKVGDALVEPAGYGTFFHGFKPEQRGNKQVTITSSQGQKVDISIAPGAPLTIKSVDGKAKGEEIVIDGSKDIVIELENGDADPKSNIHVQLICKVVGTPVIFDVIVTKAKNTIYIPKEAFKNFEGSPSPFSGKNTLIVNRVTETILEGTDAGAIRTLSAYMDWMPITLEGDIAKGSVMTSGFDESKNTVIAIDLSTTGEYGFEGKKDGPYSSPPVKLIKNVAVASFIVKGNLTAEETTTGGGWKTTTTKYFPKLQDETWQKLVEKLYAEMSADLKTEMGWNILPLNRVVNAESYAYAKPIEDGSTDTKVEVGAGGTKRILTTTGEDWFKDMGISFVSDFVASRLTKELGVDAVLAITIDLDFDFQSEGLNPRISITAYAPDVSYKTASKYFTLTASTEAKSLRESQKYQGSTEDALYQMIKAETLSAEFIAALKELSSKEDEYPVYEKLWKAKL
jgi:hypothetical protein